MTDKPKPPFSVRNRGPHAQVLGDFPVQARNKLMHLLHDGVDHYYLQDWVQIAYEMQRISGEARQPYTSNDAIYDAQVAVENYAREMPWQKMFDFCEALHSSLISERVPVLSTEHRRKVAFRIQALFLEEGFAYDFVDGEVLQRGRHHTTEIVSRANYVLGDVRLEGARKHYQKAQKYFQDPQEPDLENTVKEAVCAVEATARALLSSGDTLGEAIKDFTGDGPGKIPRTIAKTFEGLYALRNSGMGVGHGGATGGRVTQAIAEYALALSASQIILLVDLANELEPEIPF